MKKLVKDVEGEGFSKLLGENVLLMCVNYFYYGKLTGVSDTCVLLENASIVYETGDWMADDWKDAQRLPTKEWYVQISAIESFGSVKK